MLLHVFSCLSRRSCFAALFVPAEAWAARGAAELDAEYYLRSALGLDKRDIFERREPRLAPTPPDPRPLDPAFKAALLDTIGEPPGDEAEACANFYRRLAALDKRERELAARRVGDALLAVLAPNATGLRAGAQAVVDAWAATGWIEPGSVARFADDDDQDDDPRPLQVTLKSPLTARVAADLERSGLIFHPDLTGLSLAAYFRKRGLSSNFDEYLLDDTYRTDPRAFVASSTLLLFPLDDL